MKKIIFGILSLLLITPVFAEDIRTSSYNNQITFEEFNTNTNVTYVQKNVSSLGRGTTLNRNQTLFGAYNTDYTFITPGSLYSSLFTGYGYDVSLNYAFSQLNNNTFSVSPNRFEGWGIVASNFSGSSYDFDSLQVLYVRPVDDWFDGNNSLISFGNSQVTGNYNIFNDNYIRVFYNNGDFDWYSNGLAPGLNITKNIPVNYQVFTLGSSSVKFKNYNLKLPALGTFYTPSISYGFSFINSSDSYTWSSLKFYSVFPYFDYLWSGQSLYNLPTWAYSDKFYIFRVDGLSAGSYSSHIGVLSKCSSSYCDGSGVFSNMLYSEYSCNGLGFNTGSYKIDFSNCSLIRGGIVENILPFSDSSTPVDVAFVSNNFKSNILDVFNSPTLSLGQTITYPQDYAWHGFGNFYINSSDKLCYKVDQYSSYNYAGEYNGCYNIDFSNNYDILGSYDNTRVPLSTGDIYAIGIKTFCDAFPDSSFCSGNPIFQNSGSDVSIGINNSGQVQATITIYDTEDEDCPDLYYTGSEGYLYHQYYERGRCLLDYSIPQEDSSPEFGLDDFSDTGQYTQLISGAFVGILSGFNIHQCPFRSPFGVLRLGTIGGMGSFLLDKFFDVNIIGPFSCLLGGVLYSTSDSQSLSSQLVHYDGEKFLNNRSQQSKDYLNYLLIALIVILFRRFRPNSNSDH